MKHDLSDVTFLIPMRAETRARLDNLRLVLAYLTSRFQTHVIVSESDTKRSCGFVREFPNVTCLFECQEGLFHRTRLLNEMTMMAPTEICVNYDGDVLFEPQNYLLARQLISERGYHMVWPYAGRVIARRHVNDAGKAVLRRTGFSFGTLRKGIEYEPAQVPDVHPGGDYPYWIGGAVFFRRSAYAEIGMENEAFLEWGREDGERFRRAARFLRIAFLDDHFEGNFPGYHLSHPRADHQRQDYLRRNTELLDQLSEMADEQMIDYYRTADYPKRYGITPFSCIGRGAVS